MTAAPDSHADRRRSPESARAVCVRVDRAMAMLDIGKTKLYELIASGELETIHIGRRTLVLHDSIDQLVQRLRRPDAAEQE